MKGTKRITIYPLLILITVLLLFFAMHSEPIFAGENDYAEGESIGVEVQQTSEEDAAVFHVDEEGSTKGGASQGEAATEDIIQGDDLQTETDSLVLETEEQEKEDQVVDVEDAALETEDQVVDVEDPALDTEDPETEDQVVEAEDAALETEDAALETEDAALETEDQIVDSNVQTALLADDSDRVNRIYGDDMYGTSFAVADALKRNLKVDKFSNVVVATGKQYPDALSGAYLANTLSAPILLISDEKADSVLSYIDKNLKNDGKIYILGGTAAVSQEVEDKLSKYSITRLAGDNMYGTNLEILKAVNANKMKEMLVATGTHYADSLSGSSVELPLMLVGKSLNDAQKDFLSTFGVKENNTFYILGGTAAVSESVEGELSEYSNIKRVYGSNMYETAIEAAKVFHGDSNKEIIVTTGKHYADGIVGGPLAMARNAAIIFTANDNAAYAYNYIAKKGFKKITGLGGDGAYSKSIITPANTTNDFFKVGSNTYYIKSNGTMAKEEWIEIGKTKYYFNAKGLLKETTSNPVLGIDVSQFNGVIDWKKVKADGVEFAFIRVGGRYSMAGYIYNDSLARINLAGAIEAGLKVGVYFFTQAVTEAEAIQEAKYTLNAIKGFDITMPVAIDTEEMGGGRHDKISAAQRTKVVKAFLDHVKDAGYWPMLYAGQYWIKYNLIASELTDYDVWMPQYYYKCTYEGDYICWQFSSTGSVKGINGNVDMNWWYGGGF